MKKLLRKLAEKILSKYEVKRLGEFLGDKGSEDRFEFENKILNLLKEYKLFDPNVKNILQKTVITLEVRECPVIELKSLIFEHETPVNL